jgi:hypothetical protein
MIDVGRPDIDLSEALREISHRLTEEPLTTFFEPAFKHDEVLVRSDLLFPDPAEARG